VQRASCATIVRSDRLSPTGTPVRLGERLRRLVGHCHAGFASPVTASAAGLLRVALVASSADPGEAMGRVGWKGRAAPRSMRQFAAVRYTPSLGSTQGCRTRNGRAQQVFVFACNTNRRRRIGRPQESANATDPPYRILLKLRNSTYSFTGTTRAECRREVKFSASTNQARRHLGQTLPLGYTLRASSHVNQLFEEAYTLAENKRRN
jgi:hypothetical protein